jgi:Gas vesicle synthesis protein GvpL/GvpF
VIHVYGVVDELDSLPPSPGVDDAPLERHRVGELELVVSRAGAGEVTHEAVLRHAEVVDELMSRSRAVLPVQFSAFADDEELAVAIESKREALERALGNVRGCVEFGLRVAGASQDGGAASSGTDYMRARLAEEQLAAALHKPLAQLSRATTARSTSDRAYLVPASNVDAFREQVGRLQSGHPELTIVCTGPWPPYSFTAPGEEE